ncbi:hypothetical protein [Actinacidiphila rubida]|uniref:Uncharacterized protein n=1 Tax=Actinacidiphila rubida TaxID=310780 RepID=A0A1H8R9Q7_9ACTN|nr:hypothetical protein [Actinacidiphila rubida]SEO62653.1 hypothetical protein SAMN05216267_103346 [Actinacidiphila rubida]
MEPSARNWVERVQHLPDKPSQQEAEKLVREVYQSAQKELDDQRAQAEFEREE